MVEWVFVYELSSSGFESSCSHLKFRFRTCFEQGVPWHSGNYRVWIHSETRPWRDKNIQSKLTSFKRSMFSLANISLKSRSKNNGLWTLYFVKLFKLDEKNIINRYFSFSLAKSNPQLMDDVKGTQNGKFGFISYHFIIPR